MSYDYKPMYTPSERENEREREPCFVVTAGLAGRHMDRDGVTFGDFGTGGVDGRRGNGGSGGGRGGGKPVVDQDLMDTWYPDCRECTCCKVCSEEEICEYTASVNACLAHDWKMMQYLHNNAGIAL